MSGDLARTLAGCVLAASIPLSIRSASAQSDIASHNRIIGVFDSRSGQPLEGAIVLDVLTGRYTTTSGTGTASLRFITFRDSAALIEIRKLGFQPKQLVVNRSDTVSITEVLEPVVELPAVVRRERYRLDQDAGRWEGFAQRCQSKSVTCFTPGDLEAHPNASIADFLVKADGVVLGSCAKLLTITMGHGVVERGPNARDSQCGNAAMHPSAGPGYCQPTFFVDGFEWDSNIGPPIDVQPGRPATGPYTAANVKAIEVYSSEKVRPLKFEGDFRCGVVVLWTK